MVVHFKSVKIDVLHVQNWKEPVIIASECQNFDLVCNSFNSEIFLCPYGSSLWDALNFKLDTYTKVAGQNSFHALNDCEMVLNLCRHRVLVNYEVYFLMWKINLPTPILRRLFI